MSKALLRLLVIPAIGVLACAAERAPETAAVTTAPPRSGASWSHDWAKGAVFYEVFVRSFQDSNGDGKGDLEGLISRLDYLNDGKPETTDDLGIDGIWLMPVFKSPSYHGYDTTDYDAINPDYGTNDDFKRLCEEAHERGIRVIVDLVANHSGSGHPWFVESASSPSSPKRDYYVWSATDPGWKQPWNQNQGTWYLKNGAFFYGLFWSGMPDLNFNSPAVRAEMKAIAKRWLDLGADGFRLDASRYLIETGGGPAQADTVETHAYWRDFAASVRSAKPEAVLVAENWTDTAIIAAYYGSTATIPEGDELPMNFDFPLSDQILQGVNGGNATGIAAKLDEIARVYPKGVTDTPFLTNHDQVRLATQFGRSAGKLRNAAAVLLTLPGMPFLYYGEEVGLENGTTSNDEAKRTPMPWTGAPGGGFTTGTPWFSFAPGQATANIAAQTVDPSSLLSRYRQLIRVRKSSSALQRGDLQLLTPTSGGSPALAFVRTDGTVRRIQDPANASKVFVAHNLSDGFVTAGPYAFPAVAFEKVFADTGVADPSGTSGAWRVTLPPRTTGIWRIR